MAIEHIHQEESDASGEEDGIVGRQPRHSLASSTGAPGGWKRWEDVPLVLKPPELARVLRVSRATVYAALKDGTIPSFRVRGSLRCTRGAAWAVANGLDPWEYVGHDPFGGTPMAAVS